MTDLTWVSERITVRRGSDPVKYYAYVWPNEDLIEHDPYMLSCPCIPRYKITIGIHGSNHDDFCICSYNELVHHSLDGRELSE